MSKPRVAIVGSCVTRDNFNSHFVPSYKKKVEVVASVYQSSLPSLVRERPVEVLVPETTPMYKEILEEEYSENNLDNLADSKPDFVILDGYADIQFGVTRLEGQYVTRNHMAFQTERETDLFYDDTGAKEPERGRFGESAWYDELIVSALTKLVERIKERNKRARFIVNSARFALRYTALDGQISEYEKPNRLIQKNKHWERFDNLVIVHGANTLSYPDAVFMVDERHRWGLNQVHYQQDFYNQFWQQLDKQLEA